MIAKEFNELVDDIRENGLREPVIMFENKILDGRSRYLACKRAKVKPIFKELGEEDPALFVISTNLRRRNLSQDQKAMALTKIVGFSSGWQPEGRPKKLGPGGTVSAEQAAKTAGVGTRTIKRAKAVSRKSVKKAAEVMAGEKTLKQALQEIKEEQEAKSIVVDEMGYPVPKPALEYWNRANEPKELLKQISKLKTAIEEIQARKDLLYAELSLGSFLIELSNLYHSLKQAVPYVVCTACQGQLPDTCTLCKGRGVISEFLWKHAIPIEIRKMREDEITTQASAAA
jgi:predicted regulator of amino acid metabolism with ACT domain